MFRVHNEHTAYQLLILQLVVHLINANRHVLGILTTRVHVAVVFGNQVNVVETVTVVVVLVESIDEGCIHYDRFIECSVSHLKNKKEDIKISPQKYQLSSNILPVLLRRFYSPAVVGVESDADTKGEWSSARIDHDKVL